jgi:hypothetical protein
VTTIGRSFVASLLALAGGEALAVAQDAPAAKEPATEGEEDWSLFSKEDGWLDASGFLDQTYGFLPIVLPITEPAVGYGAAGALAFIDKPIGEAKAGHHRPNITLVGGMGTENGTWGALAGDVRHWFDDRLQTIVGVVDASVNLDFHGIGEDSLLNDHPLEYTLAPVGGLAQAKYRLGDTRAWVGLAYAYATTRVDFEAPASAPGTPSFERDTEVGGLTPSLSYDSRDNVFTPKEGIYVEGRAGLYSPAFGGDDRFERVGVSALAFTPLSETLFLGLRGDAAASYGDAPFYMRPFVSLRGVPIMRYQGEEMAQLESELRWQFWERFSLVGFAGLGAAWNDFEELDAVQTVLSGGGGFRYELARSYGIHAGLDVAFSRDTAAVYIQVGSAWARP